ncbi:unnamed protein product, partial [Prorocentrum cordatum]
LVLEGFYSVLGPTLLSFSSFVHPVHSPSVFVLPFSVAYSWRPPKYLLFQLCAHMFPCRVCFSSADFSGLGAASFGLVTLNPKSAEHSDSCPLRHFKARGALCIAISLQDVPTGLCFTKGVAELLGVQTATIDVVLKWAQGKLGKEFLTDANKMAGKDIAETRAPQAYGVKTRADLKKFLSNETKASASKKEPRRSPATASCMPCFR